MTFGFWRYSPSAAVAACGSAVLHWFFVGYVRRLRGRRRPRFYTACCAPVGWTAGPIAAVHLSWLQIIPSAITTPGRRRRRRHRSPVPAYALRSRFLRVSVNPFRWRFPVSLFVFHRVRVHTHARALTHTHHCVHVYRSSSHRARPRRRIIIHRRAGRETFACRATGFLIHRTRWGHRRDWRSAHCFAWPPPWLRTRRSTSKRTSPTVSMADDGGVDDDDDDGFAPVRPVALSLPTTRSIPPGPLWL